MVFDSVEVQVSHISSPFQKIYKLNYSYLFFKNTAGQSSKIFFLLNNFFSVEIETIKTKRNGKKTATKSIVVINFYPCMLFWDRTELFFLKYSGIQKKLWIDCRLSSSNCISQRVLKFVIISRKYSGHIFRIKSVAKHKMTFHIRSNNKEDDEYSTFILVTTV